MAVPCAEVERSIAPCRSASAARAKRSVRSARLLFVLGISALSACSPRVDGRGGGDAGGPGRGSGGAAALVSATWTIKTSNATCPSGPCPIVLDEELTSDDTYFGAV